MITGQRYAIQQVGQLPDEPGVYRFYSTEGTLIYVGKAKSLKKRVSSYFNKSANHSRKTLKLVSEIESLDVTLVNNEYDALLLENNLIKQYQPKYNILLKDDKSFPFLLITQERFPKLLAVRNRKKNAGTYYGPYASVKAMYSVKDLIHKLFTLRSCTLQLSQANIANNKFKVCLEYHIGNCKGPCEGLQSEEEYLREIQEVKNILSGRLSLPQNYLINKMNQAAEALQFELANQYKIRLELLDAFKSKSEIVNPSIGVLDVLTLVEHEKSAYLNFLQIENGSITSTYTFEAKKTLDETEEELFLQGLANLRNEGTSRAKEIITNVVVQTVFQDFTIIVPKIGDKKKLVELSLKNALYYKKEKISQADLGKQKEDRVLSTLQRDLQLKTLPKHIECFDNSNLQGSNPVASMVCFKMARPSKKDYRKFNIRTVDGPNDFASMTEIVGRRYKRMLEENEPLPDLIVIDGGKGQLSAACEALNSLGIYGKVPIIGIAKRLEEIYFPEDSYPIHIEKKSESLRLLQRLRDEAHRFAITFHRDKRSKASIQSALLDIPGIGEKTLEALLKEFKSVKKIKEADEESIATIVGKEKARLIKNELK
ncbi:excinuclease ABC subunit UvrC [Cytophagales bacterium LB-30]|uniref:UvrABC system protein C n=1 Tax=Shiella aurantiaca TaxID=3058365 RepID=A0ABT8F878_9BACT|nr:excinuclease ABC subunit UvrC [Shiella aurantiaca]MDN4166146.1 excinuclease ABC subunit UvrC [Shiella aurantiaca]